MYWKNNSGVPPQQFHNNVNMIATTLTILNNVLCCLVEISFNEYSKTVFDFKIGSDSCHPKLPVCKIMIIKI